MIIYEAFNKVTCMSYVGKTVQVIEDRIVQHLRSANKGKKGYFYNAIRKYNKECWIWSIVEVINPLDKKKILENKEYWKQKLNDREIYWIATKNSMVPNGYNLTKGGDGGHTGPLSEEKIEYLRKINIGKKLSERHKRKISESNKGKYPSKEIKDKISKSLKEFYNTEEGIKNRKKLSNIKTGKKFTEEHKEKISKGSKGRVVSQETRRKISLAQKGKKLTEEHKAKLRKPKRKKIKRIIGEYIMAYDIIEDLLQSQINEEEFPDEVLLSCPFCLADSSYIDTYEIEEDDEGELDPIEQPFVAADPIHYSHDDSSFLPADQGIGLYPNTEFYCNKCKRTFIFSKDGEALELADEIDDGDLVRTGDLTYLLPNWLQHEIKTKKSNIAREEVEVTEVVGKRMRRRARKKSNPKQRRANLKMARIKRKKESQGERLRAKVSGSKNKKVVFREGKYKIVKKDFRGRVKKTGAKKK